jgi:hypothetical protein
LDSSTFIILSKITSSSSSTQNCGTLAPATVTEYLTSNHHKHGFYYSCVWSTVRTLVVVVPNWLCDFCEFVSNNHLKLWRSVKPMTDVHRRYHLFSQVHTLAQQPLGGGIITLSGNQLSRSMRYDPFQLITSLWINMTPMTNLELSGWINTGSFTLKWTSTCVIIITPFKDWKTFSSSETHHVFLCYKLVLMAPTCICADRCLCMLRTWPMKSNPRSKMRHLCSSSRKVRRQLERSSVHSKLNAKANLLAQSRSSRFFFIK